MGILLTWLQLHPCMQEKCPYTLPREVWQYCVGKVCEMFDRTDWANITENLHDILKHLLERLEKQLATQKFY